MFLYRPEHRADQDGTYERHLRSSVTRREARSAATTRGRAAQDLGTLSDRSERRQNATRETATPNSVYLMSKHDPCIYSTPSIA